MAQIGSAVRLVLLGGAALLAGPVAAQQSAGGVTQLGGITSFDPAEATEMDEAESDIDFIRAAPVSLPVAEGFVEAISATELARALTTPPEIRLLPQVGRPIVQVGSDGSGAADAANLGEPRIAFPQDDAAASVDFGTSRVPFTTAQADVPGLRINEESPYRAAGKLFYVDTGSSFVCSGALIERGIVGTAAHCVSEFGDQRFFSNWSFAPGYRNGDAPFGEWTAAKVYIMSSYFNGTDLCHPSSPGVVCENDVAVILLEPKTSESGEQFYAGDLAGWYALGYNQAGFTPQGTAQVTQIGYPGCLDSGAIMQRNESLANISAEYVANSIFGSLMCGGSSGGPILVNFGNQSSLTGTVSGNFPNPNVVIGFTSWGSSNNLVKRMGASPLRDTNIRALLSSACRDTPDACS